MYKVVDVVIVFECDTFVKPIKAGRMRDGHRHKLGKNQ